jgi:phage terminase large subunit
MTKTNQFKFLDAYAPIFDPKYTYYIISGGRGSGKSYNIGAYFIMKLISPEYFRGVIARYTQASLTKSIYQDILDMAEMLGVTSWLNISGDTIACKYNRNKIVTHSMKIGDGAMTAKGKGLSGITHLLIDEATEIKSEHEYIKLTDSIRTKGVERKIFILFNPEAKSHWLHQRFFIDGKPNPKWFTDHCFIHTTFRENPELDPIKAKEYSNYEFLEPDRYKYEIQGNWHDFVRGRVFDNWKFEYDPHPEADTIYGLDFGFSQDPCALIKVSKRNNKIWAKELLYETGMTNGDIAETFSSFGIKKTDLIIADSAEPKSIEEIKRLGWNIKGASKGNDSIRSGINKIRECEVYVDPSSNNLINEYQNYAWKKDTNRPIDSYNHLIDAFRYSLSLEKQTVKRFAISGIR